MLLYFDDENEICNITTSGTERVNSVCFAFMCFTKSAQWACVAYP